MPEARVRELARDALVELAPVSVRGVETDWRGQLADYVLGQQSGPEATATKGHLRRSEAARSWARSLLDSLEQLYANGSVPAIPDGERGRAKRPAPEPSAAPAGAAGLSAAPAGARGLASDPVMRRRLLAGAAAAAVILLVVLVWPVGLLTGDDNTTSSASSDNQAEHPGRKSEPAGRDQRASGDRDRGGPGRQEAAARAGGAARAQRPERGLLRLALQQPERRALARRPGDRPAGQLPGHRRLPGGLRQVQVHRRDRSGGRPRGALGRTDLRGRCRSCAPTGPRSRLRWARRCAALPKLRRTRSRAGARAKEGRSPLLGAADAISSCCRAAARSRPRAAASRDS